MAESLGWTHPDKVFGDLVLLQDVRAEAQVARGKLAVRRLDGQDRNLRLRGQKIADAVHLGADFREGLVRVVVELQPGGDRRNALGTLRLEEINPVRGRNGLFKRGRDKPADKVRARSYIHGRHRDRGVLALGILPDVQRKERLDAGDDDHQAHDKREHRPPNEKVGQIHGRAVQELSGVGWSLASGTSVLSISIASPFLNLNTPEVTMTVPASMPEVTATKSPRLVPRRTNFWRAIF